MFAALLIAAGFWLFQGKMKQKIDFSPSASIRDRATVEKAIALIKSGEKNSGDRIQNTGFVLPELLRLLGRFA